MPNPVIFLDIDGVLVTRRSCIPCGKGLIMSSPDPCGANLIKELCIKTGAKIVISSTWRFNEKDLFDLLSRAGIDRHFIYTNTDCPCGACWRTPLAHKKLRGIEIQEWAEKHGVDKYVIFDDDSDFLEHQKPFLMKTEFNDGILTKHFNDALKILKEFAFEQV